MVVFLFFFLLFAGIGILVAFVVNKTREMYKREAADDDDGRGTSPASEQDASSAGGGDRGGGMVGVVVARLRQHAAGPAPTSEPR